MTMKLTNMFPKEAFAGMSNTIRLLGEEFVTDSKVYMNGQIITSTFVSPNEITVTLADTVPFGRYLFRIVNPSDGRPDRLEESREMELRLLAKRSDLAVPRYPVEILDQRNQPLPVPFMERGDAQRVWQGSQFDGTLPSHDYGIWGTTTTPTSGGLWRYSDKVKLEQFEFRSNGAEPGAGRTAGSGLYKRRRDGTDMLIINLSNTPDADKGQVEYFFASDLDVTIEQGEAIVFKTFGATREMLAVVTVKAMRLFV